MRQHDSTGEHTHPPERKHTCFRAVGVHRTRHGHAPHHGCCKKDDIISPRSHAPFRNRHVFLLTVPHLQPAQQHQRTARGSDPAPVRVRFNPPQVKEGLTGVDEGGENGLVALLSRFHQHPEGPFRTENGHQVCSDRAKHDGRTSGVQTPGQFLFPRQKVSRWELLPLNSP